MSATRNEDLEEAIKDFTGPQRERPLAWQTDPLAAEAHREMARRFLLTLPSYPGNRSGRGVLYVGGGKYDCGIYLGLKMLRHVGCDLPVQVWHRGPMEHVSACVREIPGVTVIDAEQHPLRPTWRDRAAHWYILR